MIFVTGDTHGDLEIGGRFSTKNFPIQKNMTKADCVIISGDFGLLWADNSNEDYWLDWLEKKPFTTLFIDGNHENFDLLGKYPVEDWNGGKVHFIRPSVIHLMRGQVFTIDGCKIFTMGGARSQDIEGGILETDDPQYLVKLKRLNKDYVRFRVNHLSWWDEEMPSKEEMYEGLVNLVKHENKVDYIITHEVPTQTKALLGLRNLDVDQLSEYLQLIDQTVKYKKWYFGHYHIDTVIVDGKVGLYHDVVQIW